MELEMQMLEMFSLVIQQILINSDTLNGAPVVIGQVNMTVLTPATPLTLVLWFLGFDIATGHFCSCWNTCWKPYYHQICGETELPKL
jgi:hypothetical protein